MNTGAVITAAGMSSRMGQFKPLMNINGKSMIKTLIDIFNDCGVSPIAVVTGNNAELIENHLKDEKNAVCIFNKNYKNCEMSDSAKLGFEFIEKKCSRVLFTPADIPLIKKETVKNLIKTEGMIVKPVYKGRGGHPLLIDNRLIKYILEFKGTGGIKKALSECGHQIIKLNTQDKGILLDADTPQDFQNLMEYNKYKVISESLLGKK